VKEIIVLIERWGFVHIPPHPNFRGLFIPSHPNFQHVKISKPLFMCQFLCNLVWWYSEEVINMVNSVIPVSNPLPLQSPHLFSKPEMRGRSLPKCIFELYPHPRRLGAYIVLRYILVYSEYCYTWLYFV